MFNLNTSNSFIKRFNQEQQFLLVTSRTNKNKWIVPGGGIDPGELPKTAAIREVDEEVSINKIIYLLVFRLV